MIGVVVVDKPKDITSHQAVERVKKILNVKKAGHTGTLDPFATGVLTVCLNNATKLIPYLMEDTKEYYAEMVLGISTDTLDCTGNTIFEKDIKNISQTDVSNIICRFKGKLKQIPPMYSAVKIKGKKLYNLARKGIEIERTPREVVINDIKLLDFIPPVVKFSVSCSKGTYIRSLASDIGGEIGCGAHLSELRRLSSGRFCIENSHNFDEIESGNYKLLSVNKVLSGYKSIKVNSDLASRIRNGIHITKDALLQIKLPNFARMDIITTLFNEDVISISEAQLDSSQFEYAEDKDIIFQHLRILN
ncbi:MAG: tRNA pseudouridine(55) synthase TruB [Thermodesulfobacteriota bacterium]